MSTPTSTIDTFLAKKSGSSYSIVAPIKEFPDLGGSPESIDVTTLSDHMRMSVPGIQDVDSLEFPMNYDLEDYTTIKGYEGAEGEWAVVFGKQVTTGQTPTTTYGGQGIFHFKGYPTVWVNGAGVNDAREMTTSISLTSEITVLDSITIA